LDLNGSGKKSVTDIRCDGDQSYSHVWTKFCWQFNKCL